MHQLVVYLNIKIGFTHHWRKMYFVAFVATQNISPFPQKNRKSILGVPQEHKDAPKSTWNPKRGPWTMDFHFAATEASDPETAEETALRLRRLRKAQRRGFGPVALGWRRGEGSPELGGKSPENPKRGLTS